MFDQLPVPRRIRRTLRRSYVFSARRQIATRIHIGRRPSPSLIGAGSLDAIIASNIHGTYCVPRSSIHRPAAYSIIRSRVWEPETIELLRKIDPHGDVVHAGTYFGDFLPALARSRSNGAIIWAFEPNSENFRCAQVTVLLNNLKNVVLTHAALDAQGGDTAVLMTRNPQGVSLGGMSRLVDTLSGTDSRCEQVPLVTIDDMISRERHVAVLQLDIEGHEQYALEGALQTIRRCRPLMLLETVPERAWFASALGPLGYVETGRVHGNTIVEAL